MTNFIVIGGYTLLVGGIIFYFNKEIDYKTIKEVLEFIK